MTKLRCALYLRVSTEEQTVENQLPALKAFAQARSWEIVEIYQEEESAWKSGHQSELARLKSDAAKRRFNVVLVWALDRLTREGIAAILKLVDQFKLYGVRLISYQESWTEAPGELGELLYAITGWAGKFESERRSSRTRAGLERAKKHGTRSGIPTGKRGPDKKKRHRRWLRRPLEVG